MCSRQGMVDVCASFTLDMDMKFNSKKSVVVRVGPRLKEPCEPIMLCNKQLSFVSGVKYMGVCLVAGLKFKVSLHEMKRKSFRSFNSVYHKCSRANPETVVLQLVS